MSEPRAPTPRHPESKAARNERRKALATTLNALSVAVLVASIFQPLVAGYEPNLTASAAAFLAFVVFQFALHYVLSRLED